MNRLDAEQVIDALGRLPSLPAAMVRILDAFADGDPEIGFLVTEIGHDQALAARVLRIANSSFYGLERRVDSIRDAIVVLGLRNIRATVSAAAVATCFAGLRLANFDFPTYWRHCAAVGLAARGLAKVTRRPVEAAFTAGLLHDLGLLALISTFPEHMARVFDYARGHACLIFEAERQVIGIDHSLVGKALAERWKFPPLVCEAIGGHHSPDDELLGGLAGLAHVAEALVCALGIFDSVSEWVPPVSDLAFNRLGLNTPELKTVMSEVEAGLDATCQALFA